MHKPLKYKGVYREAALDIDNATHWSRYTFYIHERNSQTNRISNRPGPAHIWNRDASSQDRHGCSLCSRDQFGRGHHRTGSIVRSVWIL